MSSIHQRTLPPAGGVDYPPRSSATPSLVAVPVVLRRAVELHSVDEVASVLGDLYASGVIEPERASAFGCRLEISTVGSLKVITGSWQAGWEAETPAVHDRYILSLSAGGGERGTHGSHDFTVVSERRAALFSPGQAIQLEVGPRFEGRTLTIERTALESHVLSLTGRSHHGPIHFEPALDLEEGPGAVIARLAAVLRHEVLRSEGSSLLIGALQEALMTSLLVGQKHSALALFEGQPPRIAPRQVRRAEEFIEAHATEAITLSDIAAAAGVSARSLQVTFKANRGVSPMEWLRRVRFDLVRDRLMSAEPEATVRTIIGGLAVGGASGRFSVDYRKRFGESPSATLARTRGELRGPGPLRRRSP